MFKGKTAVLLLSGGMDSATLGAKLSAEGAQVEAISILYGQRHHREVSFAEAIARRFEWPHQIINLSNLGSILGGSSLTDRTIDVPEGHYEEESMKATVVPNRNMVLLSIATAYAISKRAQYVAYAAHAGDHAIYPDCRDVFVQSMRTTVSLCDWDPPQLIAPFTLYKKQDIVSLGDSLHVPFSLTWSCYKGGSRHCGKCGTCVERREAFQLAGIEDPTEYE